MNWDQVRSVVLHVLCALNIHTNFHANQMLFII